MLEGTGLRGTGLGGTGLGGAGLRGAGLRGTGLRGIALLRGPGSGLAAAGVAPDLACPAACSSAPSLGARVTTAYTGLVGATL